MVKLVETLNRSTTLSMFYIACCSVVLMHYNMGINNIQNIAP